MRPPASPGRPRLPPSAGEALAFGQQKDGFVALEDGADPRGALRLQRRAGEAEVEIVAAMVAERLRGAWSKA